MPCIVCVCSADAASQARLKSLQLFSLLVLVVQNAALVLIMRYARTRTGDMFMATSAVVSAEVLKLVFCLIVILFERRGDVAVSANYICDVSGLILSFRRFSLRVILFLTIFTQGLVGEPYNRGLLIASIHLSVVACDH
jgi:hypothetical protein